MNQILITEKLYITPELKKKKKLYKVYFVLCMFLTCILMTFYIYAEYDKNKSIETSQELLAEITELLSNTSESEEDYEDLLVVAINPLKQDKNSKTKIKIEKEVSKNGYIYSKIGIINVPKYNINYSILEGEQKTLEEYDELLKMSPCKYKGPDLNEIGNVSILGHNYRNNRFFSKIPSMQVGDIVEITDLYGETIQYAVYDKYSVEPTDLSGTEQKTNRKREITLIACTDDGNKRVMLKCREVQ